MINIFRQAWAQLKAQKMLGIISIVGTALAIFLIMVVVMLQQVKVVPFAPESNRDRLLHASMASIKTVDGADNYFESNGPLSYESARKLFYALETPEAVSIYEPGTSTAPVSLPASQAVSVDIRNTDDNFWKVFDFSFVSGKPYDKAAFDSGLAEAVICESVARRLFGSVDVAGKEILINYVPYTVAGVVKDVSTLAGHAYASVWVPFTSTNMVNWTWNYDIMGSLGVTILARNRDDFDRIRHEYEENVRQLNKEIESTGWEMITRNRPYDQEKEACGAWANIEPDVEGARRMRWIIFAILLIVPAVNLSSMSESRLRRRVEEIGVRRAFGCRRSELFAGIVGENLVTTLIAGMLGWIMSVIFAWLFSSFLFTAPYSTVSVMPKVDITMLVQPSTFLWAILFCFVLNLLSTGLPAWRASRINVVNALNAKL